MTKFDRITFDPLIMGGRPCIRGMRVTAGVIVGMIAAGRTIEEILRLYPYLEREDVVQALEYAAWRSEEREVMLPIA
jgi:uncharacterized protein (DUF433 family)